MNRDYKSTISASAREQKFFRNIPSNIFDFSNTECSNSDITA